MKNCPYCTEAMVCRYCFHDLRPTPSTLRGLMSTMEYILNWLKVNKPELYSRIVEKMAETEEKPIPLNIHQQQR